MTETIRTSDARDAASNLGMVLLLLVMLALFGVLVWSLQQQNPQGSMQQSQPSAMPGGGIGRAGQQ